MPENNLSNVIAIRPNHRKVVKYAVMTSNEIREILTFPLLTIRAFAAIQLRTYLGIEPDFEGVSTIVTGRYTKAELAKAIAQSARERKGPKRAIPKDVLSYIARRASHSEAALLLLYADRAMLSKGNRFRVRLDQAPLPFKRVQLSRAQSRLIKLGLIIDLDPEKRHLNHPRTVQTYGRALSWARNTVCQNDTPHSPK